MYGENKTVKITVRITEELATALAQEAQVRDMKLSEYIRDIFDKRDRKGYLCQ